MFGECFEGRTFPFIFRSLFFISHSRESASWDYSAEDWNGRFLLSRLSAICQNTPSLKQMPLFHVWKDTKTRSQGDESKAECHACFLFLPMSPMASEDSVETLIYWALCSLGPSNLFSKISLPLLSDQTAYHTFKKCLFLPFSPNALLEESSLRDISPQWYAVMMMCKEKPFSSEILQLVSIAVKTHLSLLKSDRC